MECKRQVDECCVLLEVVKESGTRGINNYIIFVRQSRRADVPTHASRGHGLSLSDR